MIEGASRSAISPDGKTVFFLRDDGGMGFQYPALVAHRFPDWKERALRGGELKDMAGSSGNLKFSPDGSKLLVCLGRPCDDDGRLLGNPHADQATQMRASRCPRKTGMAPASFSWLADNRHVIVTRSDGPTPGTHLWLADTRRGRALVL